MLHVRLKEDGRGDLVDVDYYCSQICADRAGIPQPSAWPGGMETDYDKYCANCGDFIEHGIAVG